MLGKLAELAALMSWLPRIKTRKIVFRDDPLKWSFGTVSLTGLDGSNYALVQPWTPVQGEFLVSVCSLANLTTDQARMLAFAILSATNVKEK